MDPSIVKLLEDDEGRMSKHSRLPLNEDIGGDTSTSHLSVSDANPVSSPASNMTFSQSLTQWQTSSYDNQTDCRTQQEPRVAQQQQQPSSEMELKQHGSLPEQAQNVASQDVNPPPLSQRQHQDKCHLGQTVQVPLRNPQTTGIRNPGKDTVHNHEPVKRRDPSSELQYLKLQQISYQQATVSEQPSLQIEHSKQVPFTTLLPLLLPQLPKDRAMQLQTMFMKLKKNEISKDQFVRIMKSIAGDQMLRLALTQVQSQPRTTHGTVGQHPIRMPTVSSGAKPFIDPHAQLHQRSINTTVVQSHITTTTVQVKNEAAYPTMENSTIKPQELDLPLTSQLSSQIPSNMSGIDARTPPKKPNPCQKKPIEALDSLTPALSKKQKLSTASLEESIEQLNDVTACSGVDLTEEQEYLFSRHKEDIRDSEASRRFVHDEEERLILRKAPLRNKLFEIMFKCGLNGLSKDVERCLSLSVEEKMRELISNLIRLSKQRVDFEKTRQQIVFTSSVRQDIMTINKKAREEWENKQAEADKFRKINKDANRSKSTRGDTEEDKKMRTNAANVAVRAAVGGDDILSKWQLMAEQARQKREGQMDTSSSSQPAKDVNRESSLSSGRSTKDNQEGERKGSARKFGRNHVITPQARSISVKDVTAVLEREPQMSKSPLIYRLYERIHPNASAE